MRLELRGLTKRFGSFVANDHIDLVVQPGEIHCLLGENGAGKTTLMNMLYGLLQPDEGEILLDGEPTEIGSPSDAIDAGIGMVHQHFMLIPTFTVAENIMLGREQTRGGGLLDHASARRMVSELSTRYGLEVDPDALVERIPVGIQQRVEILKALIAGGQYHPAGSERSEASSEPSEPSDSSEQSGTDTGRGMVLILDEPTAVLTPREIDELILVMRQLRDAGTAIVFITHKLEEVRAIADRVTVIRRGQVIDTVGPDRSAEELAELMVGRKVDLVVDKEPAEPGEPALVIDQLTVVSHHGLPAVDAVSLSVHAGEVLAIAGVQGNGQSELVQALVGLTDVSSGTITVRGQDLTGGTPRRHLEAGIGYIPEDRALDGYVAGFSVAENLVLDLYRHPEFSRLGGISPQAVRVNAEQRVDEFDVRTQSVNSEMGQLSGGNQQKVVLARELSRPLSVLVAGQPTRGLDVGSIEFVHRRIVEERDRGTAVLLVSTELDEILALADRIAVMCGGRVVGIVGPDTPIDQLGAMMAGLPPQQAAAEAAENPTELGAADED